MPKIFNLKQLLNSSALLSTRLQLTAITMIYIKTGFHTYSII